MPYAGLIFVKCGQNQHYFSYQNDVDDQNIRFHQGGRYNYGLRTVGKEKSFAGQNYNLLDGKNSAFEVYVALDLL
jgi:hypothetical protein